MADKKYFNDFTKKPMTAAQYSMMRGVTDFTNAEQLNVFESGHGMLIIIDKPKFITEIAKHNDEVANLLDNFCNILEYEFKNLDGIEDINAEDLEYTDGISTIAGVGKVNEQSNSDITISVTEKSGSMVTKFIKYYLDGVRDSRTQIKHYHGLIAEGLLHAGFENEVFNMLYLVTDSTGLALEAAYLLANAWPNSAKTGTLYNYDKSTIESKTIDITFKCFVLRNQEIDRRAVKMLAYINEPEAVSNAAGKLNAANASTIAGLAKEVTSYSDNQINWNSQTHAYKGVNDMAKVYDKNYSPDNSGRRMFA